VTAASVPIKAPAAVPAGQVSRRFEVLPQGLEGLVALRRQRLSDARGWLTRMFCAQELAQAGWHSPVAQINHTHTARRGTVRGMHYQVPPHAEAKLVSCLRGAVWDVAVDLRQGSPTFLQYRAMELSADNLTALLIPPGFAHGFQALTDEAELLYLHSAAHAPGFEAGLHPHDPALAVDWPLPVDNLSARDRSHPWLDRAVFSGIPVVGPQAP
jgi:dTDP-4-dehydrorhamnose 3,5-epimerase